MTEENMYQYCENNRGKDRFCNCSSACSGPCQSNLACDYPLPDGVTAIYRGGNYGSCCFETDGIDEDMSEPPEENLLQELAECIK